MTATTHPDHDGRGFPVHHADGSTNAEALQTWLVCAATDGLIPILETDNETGEVVAVVGIARDLPEALAMCNRRNRTMAPDSGVTYFPQAEPITDFGA